MYLKKSQKQTNKKKAKKNPNSLLTYPKLRLENYIQWEKQYT